MKIYEIATGYTPIPAQIGAATEIVVENLTRSFVKNEYDAEIIDVKAENRGEFDLPIVEVNVPRIFTKNDVSLGIVHKLKRVVYSIALAYKLKQILKNTEEKVVLHFHNQYNLFFFCKLVRCKLRKKALIAYTNHNGMWSLPWDETESVMKKRYFQEIESMKNSDIVFVLNKQMKECISEHIGIPENIIVEIANGVNTDVYYPVSEEKNALKEKYGLKDKLVILQVGSVNENKGQGRIVELIAPFLKSHKNAVFAYVGGVVSQEYFDEIKNIAEKLDVSEQVVYLGTAEPGIEMNNVYNIAEATVCISKYEAFPLVVIESLSAGVPIIVCSSLSILRNFGDGCVVCEPDDFEQTLTNLIGNRDDYSALRQRARNTALDKYSWEKIAQDYSRFFE